MPTSGSSRSSRSGSRCRSTTSPPAPATSSPTASSATTASPAPPTSTSTSTPAATSSSRSSSRSTCPRCCAAELARPSWKGEHVAMGTNTDPYQWVEGRYKLMRGIWEAMRDARNPCSVLTKSPLLLRDLDLLLELAEVAPVQRELLDPDARREGVAGDRAAHAAPAGAARGGGRAQPRRDPDRRPGRAADAGDQTDPPPVEAILEAVAEAGATSIGGIGLHLRGEVRGVFMDGCGRIAPISWTTTSGCTRAARTCPTRSGASLGDAAQRRRAGGRRGSRERRPRCSARSRRDGPSARR